MSFLGISFKDIFSVAAIAGAAFLTGGASLAWQMAATFGVSMIVSRIFAAKPPEQVDNGVRIQVSPSTNNSVPIVYGDAYLGGTYIDAVLSTNSKTMYYVFAISSISPNGQFTYDRTKFYYGDQLISFDGTDLTKVGALTDSAGNVTTTINGNLYINLYISDASGTITSLNGASAPSVVMGGSDIDAAYRWSATNRQMNGLAFAIVKLNYNRDAGTTQLQPITFHCSHYLNNQGCAKPGDVWYDYITNTVYGGAIDPDLLDTASVTTLNNYADELITYIPSGGGTATQSRYRINGVLDTGQTVLSNADKIMTNCDSWMAYDAQTGKWKTIPNKPEASVYALNDNNIIGSIKVGLTDISQSINQIEAKFPNKLNKDIPDYIYLETPAGLLYPNEPVNKYSTSFDLVNDSVTAQYLGNRLLEQAREDLIVTINTNYEAIFLTAGEVVSVTNSAYGWNNKLFRVMKVSETSLPDATLGASLDLNEYNSAVYDDYAVTAYTPAGNSGIASPSYFGTLVAPTITNVNTTATIPSFSVQIALPSSGRVTQISLFYATTPTPTVADFTVWGSELPSNSQPFTPGSTVEFSNINLPADTYYFGYKLSNDTYQSALSPLSTNFSWSPNPTTSAVAGTFVATWSPVIQQVPRTGGTTPVFTGIAPQLYGVAAGGSIDFVTAQTDSDASFVNNSWRIGASSTTGNGSIVATGITIGSPTDGGTFALFPAPTAQATSPATLSVPVRYKTSTGTVVQGATAVLQFLYLDPGPTGSTGTSGNQYATVTLYQWASTTPSATTGSSTYTWSSGANTGYTGGGGWSTTLPSNPGTSLLNLYIATKNISAAGGTTSTTVDWTTGVTISSISSNGATGANGTNGTNGTNGLQTATATVYQWAVTLPAAPTGTASYTWASASFGSAPSGWSLSAGTSPSVGYTLYSASVRLVDSATTTATSFNWTSATISAISYAGANGASSRTCYSKTSLSSLSSTPSTITTTGSSTFPPNDSWGVGTVWTATTSALSAGESLYQSDGIYDPSTGVTVWAAPYLSSLKVGSLSAITTNTGTLSVTGTISSANGNFAVDSSGNVTIRNATSGARLDISNNAIKVYDASGVLRVQMGDLSA